MVMNGPEGLEQFADECAKALLITNPVEFEYPVGCSLTHWPVEEIRTLNESMLAGLRGNGNLYALYTKSPEALAIWTQVYVGQRKSASLRERIAQHLIVKSERTGSMLEAVKTAVADGCKIAVSYIKIHPESLRLYVEETLISKRKDELPWNTRG